MKAVKNLRSQLNPKQIITVSAGLAVLAIWLRLWQLDQIPPGVHIIEAQNGLNALAGKFAPSIKEAQNALSIALIALSQKLTSSRVLGLRLGPAVASLGALFFFNRWLLKVYGRQVALVGTLFFAVLPWPLALSRFGGGYGLALLFITASLYLLATSWQRRGSRRSIVTIVVLAAGLYIHPSYNWFLLAVLLAGLVNFRGLIKFRSNVPTRLTIGGLVFLLAASAAAPSVITYFYRMLPNIGEAGSQLLAAVQMFNIKGPVDYGFNLAGLPLLNAFTGLMLVLGLLFKATALKRRANRTVVTLFIVGLIGFVMQPVSAPLADKTLVLVVPVITLAAVGSHYLLAQWLRTFPQNSAARNVGVVMILILLFFAVRHSYSQYFLAWRASSETKNTYNAKTIQALNYAASNKFDGERFIVGNTYDLTVAKYLNQSSNVKLITPSQIKTVKKDKQPEQYLILESSTTDAIKALAKTFPGGKLTPKVDGKVEQFLIYTAR